jgi:[ribosomal protein S5]-alanine N-acetyltransferase
MGGRQCRTVCPWFGKRSFRYSEWVELPAPTDRLTFRAWRETDLPLAMQLWGDPAVSRLVGGPFDESAVRQRLASELANQRNHGIAYWPIALANADIGCCGLRPREPARKIYELGFYLVPAHWGGGIAVEAARSVVAHAFDRVGARALFAGHHPDNVGSKRVLEKLGFCYTHLELYPPTGLEHPGYELLR